jgi:hypothetical protein
MISAVTETNEIGEETKILLKSEEKVFDQIAKIDWPIVVVAIAGLYRTGKSYLMNRLANSSKGNNNNNNKYHIYIAPFSLKCSKALYINHICLKQYK